MRVDWPLPIATLATACALLCGCPNPNLYTTPRTLNPGDLQLQIAAEGIGASYNSTTSTPNASGTGSTSSTTTASFVLPMVPTVGLRYGVVDGFELGARVANFDTLAADGKIRLLKGTLDLAVDPGLQFIYLGSISTSDGQGNTSSVSAGVVYFHVPLLVGLNVSPNVSLVASHTGVTPEHALLDVHWTQFPASAPVVAHRVERQTTAPFPAVQGPSPFS